MQIWDSYIELLSIIVISLSGMSFTMSRGWVSPTIPQLLAEKFPIWIEEKDVTYVVNVVMLGAVISSVIGGVVIDKIGRKSIILGSFVCYSLGWILIYFSVKLSHLIWARFVIGLGAGCTFASGAIYVGEISAKHNRGALCAFYTLVFNSGVPFAYTTGSCFTFKTNALVCLAVPLLALFLGIFIPETPHFYVLHGDYYRAKCALMKLRKTSDVEVEFSEICAYIELSAKVQWKDLCRLAALRPLCISLVLVATQFWTGILTIMTFCENTLMHSGSGVFLPHTASIIIGGAFLTSLAASIFSIEHLKKKKVIIFSAMSLMLCLTFLGLYVVVNTKYTVSNTFNGIPLVLLTLASIFYACGFLVVPNIYMSELFAANIKAKAITIVVITIHVHSYLVTQVFIWLMKTIYWSFFLFAFFCAMTTVFAVRWIPDTDRLSFVQIQEQLSNRQ